MNLAGAESKARWWVVALLGIALSAAPANSATSTNADPNATEIYRLLVRMTTTSDWTRGGLEGATWAPLVKEVVEGAEAPDLRVEADAELTIGKRAYDETRVVVEFEIYLTDIQRSFLTFKVSKGHIGLTRLELFNHNDEQPQFLLAFTHEGVADSHDPDNPRKFNVLAAQIQQGGVISLRRPVSQKRVLAFYYPWYGTPQGPSGRWVHWDPNQANYAATHTPLAGYYDSQDGATIARHISEAKEAGIEGFIASWWGIDTFEDRAFRRVLSVAEREGFLTTIYYEIANSTAQVVQDVRYIIENFASSPAFLKANGLPVIFFYGRVTGKFEANEWEATFHQLKQEGLDCICIADGFSNGLFEQFQGVHTYIDVFRPVDELAQRYKSNALKAKVLGKLFAATVFPGFDNSFVTAQPAVQDRQQGAFYRQVWEAAIASDPDWILITSFNEWHEGTEIEPSVEFGRQYLELTRHYVDSWIGPAATP